ncbi:MAG: ribonuclease HI [Planctomycetota bacterium]
MSKTTIYSDGACRGNPGPGGWGVLMVSDGEERELYGGAFDTTNNRMELTAAIEALKAIPAGTPAEIYTDSEYVKNGITTWIRSWKSKGWKTAARTPVKNQDLWMQLDSLANARVVSWHWVRGHVGHPGNERADQLANRGIDELRK